MNHNTSSSTNELRGIPVLQPHSPPPAPVLLAARPPGPGLLGALGWLGVLFAAQIAVAIAMQILTIGVRMASGAEFRSAAEAPPNSFALLLAGTLSTLVTAIVVVLLVFRSRAKRVLAWRLPHLPQVALVLLTVPPLTLVASEVNNWVAELLPAMPLFDTLGEAFGQFARQPLAIVIVVGCVLPGVAEEIYFRGFLGRGLVARHGVAIGTLVTAVLFGVIHIEPRQASSAVALGVALQLVYLSTKSLWAPILLHAANNTLAFTSSRVGEFLPVPGFNVEAPGGIAHTPMPLVAAATLLLVALAFLYHDMRTRWLLPDGSDWSPGFATAEEPPAAAAAVPRCSSPRAVTVLAAAAAYLAFAAAVAWVVRGQS